MSETNSTLTYTGFWTDWTKGRIQGATITLSNHDGGILQSFAATFTTFVCAQLWILVAFLIYHARSGQAPKDGLSHQRLAVLRNFGAFAASWVFAQEAKNWRGKVRRATSRSILWTLFALVFALASGLASTFTAYITTKASANRLVTSDQCGYWIPYNMQNKSDTSSLVWYTINHTLDAATYARSCYAKGENATECKKFITPRIEWTPTYAEPCPFDTDMCVSKQIAFGMTTNPIDSLTDLGINSPPSERLNFRKKTVCAPLAEIKHTEIVGHIAYYNFGPIGSLSSTRVYNTYAQNSLVGYALFATYSHAGTESAWIPIAELNRTDADVSMLFISPNSVYYSSRNQDPVFSVNSKQPNVTSPYYTSDYLVSTIGCAEQYQVCNPAKGSCSPWMGAAQLWMASIYDSDSTKPALWPGHGMSARQIAINERFAAAGLYLSMYQTVNTRSASALQVEETLWDLWQSAEIPNDQWTRELGAWFEASLARLQQEIMIFATGPAKIIDGMSHFLNDTESKTLCGNQFTRITGDTMNFSVLGLGITFGVGSLIIGLSFALGPLSKIFYDARPDISYKQRAWNEDGALLAHRRGFMTKRIIDWNDEDVPVTLTEAKVKHFSTTNEFSDRFDGDSHRSWDDSPSEPKVVHRIPRKPVSESRVVTQELLPKSPYTA